MSFRLLKSTLIISIMTTISRIFGLIRDIVIGAFFGPGLGIDVFIVSFRIPNFLRRLFAEGGFSQAFVPILSEYKEKRKDEDVQKLIDQTSATLGLILFIISITRSFTDFGNAFLFFFLICEQFICNIHCSQYGNTKLLRIINSR